MEQRRGIVNIVNFILLPPIVSFIDGGFDLLSNPKLLQLHFKFLHTMRGVCWDMMVPMRPHMEQRERRECRTSVGNTYKKHLH